MPTLPDGYAVAHCATCPARPGTPCLDAREGQGTTGVMLVADSLESYSRGGWMVGRFGKQMAYQLSRLTLRLEDFYHATAAACAPPPSALREAALTCDRLDTAIALYRPKVYVALDPLSMARLTGITAPQVLVRGYAYPERQGRGWVVPTLPVGGGQKGLTLEAHVGMWHTWLADIQKAVKIAADPTYAYDTPTIFWQPSPAEWDAYVREFLRDPTRPLAVDTEYPYKRAADMSEEEKLAALDLTHRIDEFNCAYTPDHGGSVPWAPPYIEGALAMLHASQQHGVTLFWNAQADAPRLTASGGPVFTPAHTEDVMVTARVWRNNISLKLAVVASLWPSMYRSAPWKHLGTGDAYYRGMDAIALIRGRADMHAALRAEGQWEAYCDYVRDLDPLLTAMTTAGVGIDGAQVEAVYADIGRQMAELQARMTALVPPEVRKAHVWKREAAAVSAQAALVAAGEVLPTEPLTPVPATMRARQCAQCGALGVTASHTSKKTLTRPASFD